MSCILCTDRFIRSYRLIPLAEIGKWEETAQQACEKRVTPPRRYFVLRFSLIVS
jgi:hypothetical protein